jgi:pilus assembly protein FimV
MKTPLYGMDRTDMARPASLLLLMLCALPTWVGALALGDIQLRSKLSQELEARIPLVSVEAADLEGMNIGLANAEAFDRAELDRPFVLTTMRFAVIDTDEGAFITLTTRNPVNEPFLNFLIELDWPTGHLVREYTMLLDPPVYGAALNVASEALVTPTQTAAGLTSSKGVMRTSEAGAGATQGTYGPVGRNDTLWSIANKVKKDSSVTVQQMMLAILRSNPAAFINGNVNSLRAGSILEIPVADLAKSMSAADAVVAVRRHNSTWSDLRRVLADKQAQTSQTSGGSNASSTNASGSSGVAASTTSGQSNGAAASGEVKISGGESAGQGASGTVAAGALSSLETRLDSAMEELSQLQGQVDVLNSSLGKADVLVEDMSRAVQLRDSQIAALQAQLAAAEAKVEQGGTTAQGESAASAATQPEQAQTTALEPAPAMPAPTDDATKAGAAAESEPEPAAEPQTVATPARAAPKEWYEELEEMLHQLPGGPILIGGGLGAIILLIIAAVVISRRGKSGGKSTPSTPGLEEVMQNPEVYEDQTIMAGSEDKTAMVSTAAAASSAEDEFDAGIEASPTMRADQVVEEDPLQEVNVYLAYEQFEQAEEVVRKAIEKHPDRPEYKLKLMEVQHGARDRTGFMQTVQVLEAAVGADHTLMNQARALLETLPEGSTPGGSDTGVDLGGDPPGTDTVDVGLDFDLGFSTGDDPQDPTAPIGSESSVDFDLGLDFGDADEPVASESGLDFTLDAADDEPVDLDDSSAKLDFTLDAADEIPAESEASSGLDLDLGSDETTTNNDAASNPIGVDTEVLDFDIAFGADGPLAGPPDADVESSDGDLDFDLGSMDASPAQSLDSVDGSDDPGLDIDFDLDGLDEPGGAAPDTNPDANFATVQLAAPLVGDAASSDSLLDISLDDNASSAPSFDIEMDTLDSGLEDDGADFLDEPSAPTELMLDIPGSSDGAGDGSLGGDIGLDLPDDAQSTDALDLDLDLDGPLDDSMVGDVSPPASLTPPEDDDVLDLDLGFDDDLDISLDAPAETAAPALDLPEDDDVPSLDIDLGGNDLELPEDLVDSDADTINVASIIADLAPPSEPETIALDMPGALQSLTGESAELSALNLDLPGSSDEQTRPELALGEGEDFDALFESDIDEDLGTTGESSAEAPQDSGEDDGLDLDLTGFDPLDADAETMVSEPSELLDNAAPPLDVGNEETADVSSLHKGSESSDGALDLDLGFGFDTEDDTVAPTLGLGTIDDEDDEDETLILGRPLGGAVDEVQTKLDLAQEYIAMGDKVAARDVLDEVANEGDVAQRQAATALAAQLD